MGLLKRNNAPYDTFLFRSAARPYFESPSGFDFEYGWGAREIGVGWQVVRHEATSKWGHKPMGAHHGVLVTAVQKVSLSNPLKLLI